MERFDFIVINAQIYTMEREGDIFAAMGIKDGRVAELFQRQPDHPSSLSKKVVNAQGRAILPGFTDCHMHFMPTVALRELSLSISEVKEGSLVPANLAGVKEKLLAFAMTKSPKAPILCSNYVIASMAENRLPSRFELDQWLPGRTVIFLSMDGHSSSYSTPALRQMGAFPENHDGILSGEDHEFHLGKINSLVEKNLTLSTLVSGVKHTVNDAVKYGIVCIHCLEGFEDSKKDRALWFLTKFGGILPLHLRLYVQYEDSKRAQQYVKFQSTPRIGGCGSWEMDGSVGSGTAAFYESYANDPDNYGKCYHTPEETNQRIRQAQEDGFQVSSHAIGTRAIETLLSSYESVMKSNPLLNRDQSVMESNPLRHRIDHFEFPTLEQVERAVSKLGLIITAQPGYAWMDEMFQRSYRKYLRPEQFQRQIPLKTIMDQGGILCGSSDSPVQHLNPFLQIHGMVNFPIENQRLSIYQALRTYTYNGAYATFEEKERGSLSVGKWADFIIMDEDPFLVDPSRISELTVDSSYIKGKKILPLKDSLAAFLLKGLFLPKRAL